MKIVYNPAIKEYEVQYEKPKKEIKGVLPIPYEDQKRYRRIYVKNIDFINGPGGLAFGEIWVMDNAVETAIGGTGAYVQFTGFVNNGQSNYTTPDHTQDHIIIDKAGVYLIVCSFHVESIGGGAADTVGIEIRKNNGTITFSNLHAHRKLAGGGGDIGSISVSGLISVSKGDTIEVWITNEDNATNLLLEDADLSIIQIGG
ncbi:MAG TPA: hypothetical protein ENH85_01280 [Candidatus Scalindua sp.]|nr:hypothetical protein [Candidatus Scalindua sp.]